MEAKPVAIEAERVTAGYGEPVLREVGLRARAGELLAIVGANGAGKSTLLKVLAGTLLPTNGVVRVFGEPLSGLGRQQIARCLAVVPQETDVAFGFSVGDVVMMGRAPHQGGLLLPSAADRAAVARALEECDLAELSTRSVAELSGGERRRVTIARALAQEPRILLLDEPAAYLDIGHSLALFELIRRQTRQRDVAVVAVVHDLSQVARWADTVVLLKQGSLHAEGPVGDVLRADLLAEVLGAELVTGADPDTGLRYFLPVFRPK